MSPCMSKTRIMYAMVSNVRKMERNDVRITKERLTTFPVFYSSGMQPLEIVNENILNYGNYDACLSISEVIDDEEAVMGKYCLSDFLLNRNIIIDLIDFKQKLPISVFRSGICFPSKCTALEIENVWKKFGATVNILESSCDSRPNDGSLNYVQIFVLVLLLCVLSVVSVSTFYHFKYGSINVICLSFSLINNIKRCFVTSETKSKSNNIQCLDGMRVLTFMWIIMFHEFSSRQNLKCRSLADEVIYRIIMGCNISVDTFLLITGFLISYNEMKAISTEKQFNIFTHYFTRITRLSPVLIVIVLFHLSFLKDMGDGPLWNLYISNEACKSYWWSTLLFIQNYVNVENMCVLVNWYLCVDVQLFLISPLLLILLRKKPRWSISLAGFLSTCSVVYSFVLPWTYDANSLELMAIKQNYHTHTRAVPWFMGIIFGYILYTSKEKGVNLSKVSCAFLWGTTLAIFISTILFGITITHYSHEYNIENGIHMALMHPLWTFSMCWVIYACTFGFGGKINTFLSLPIFQIPSKFTYTGYLLHYEFVSIGVMSRRTAQPDTIRDVIVKADGHLIETLFAAVILTLCIEMPFTALGRLVKSK